MFCFSVSLLLLSIVVNVCLAVNPVRRPPSNGRRQVHVRRFARIPNFGGAPPRLISITTRGSNMYVCTSTSGGRIYEVTPGRQVRLWFDVAAAMQQATGRPMDFTNPQHGGLRSVAFHPNFNSNGLLYVSVMERRNGPPSQFTYFSKPNDRIIAADSVVIEWQFNRQTGRVLTSSYRAVIRIGMQEYDHPIKQMLFRGNLLYISHGDGSVQSATAGGGLANDGLGKILRINPLRAGNRPYSVPPTNPFVGQARYRDEIYAVGFRNPHNMCFSYAGELFVTDAGRDNVEEVNIVRPGGNYGWAQREGPFVHLQGGGILTGVAPLPANDATFGYRYPNVVVGHEGPRGAGFVGQALAGGCPVENGSPLRGVFLYANFPTDGQVYYSFLGDMRRARVTGDPAQLTQARTYRARIYFDHDNNPNTPPLNLPNLREVVRREPGFGSRPRADIRFGKGPGGTQYFTSKVTGWVYEITSTKRGATI